MYVWLDLWKLRDQGKVHYFALLWPRAGVLLLLGANKNTPSNQITRRVHKEKKIRKWRENRLTFLWTFISREKNHNTRVKVSWTIYVRRDMRCTNKTTTDPHPPPHTHPPSKRQIQVIIWMMFIYQSFNLNRAGLSKFLQLRTNLFFPEYFWADCNFLSFITCSTDFAVGVLGFI